MRAGIIVSIIGHIGFVLMTMLAWEARTTLMPSMGSIVPIEIVDIAAESNVRALAEDVPAEEVSPDDRMQDEQRDVAATSRPDQPRQPNDDFNVNEIEEGLRNLENPRGPRPRPGDPSPNTRPGAGLGTEQVVAIQDRVRSLNERAMRRCWRMPADLPDPERLVVTLEFELDRNGNLRGQPRVTSPRSYTFDPDMRTAVDYALRAVRSCDFTFLPEDPVVGPHYEFWGEIEYTFRVTS